MEWPWFPPLAFIVRVTVYSSRASGVRLCLFIHSTGAVLSLILESSTNYNLWETKRACSEKIFLRKRKRMSLGNPISGKIDRCCNPFNLTAHLKKKCLRYPTAAMVTKVPMLNAKHKLYMTCIKKFTLLDDAPIVLGKLTIFFF